MADLSGRLTNRVQLTTDGLKVYLEAVDYAFGGHVDYSMLVKIYGNDPEAEKRYSPAQCIACEIHHDYGHSRIRSTSTPATSNARTSASG